MGERLTQDQVAEIRQRFGGTASADADDLLDDMSALLDHAEATADPEPDDREGLVEAERRVRTVGEYVIEKAAAGNADAEKVMAHRALRDRLKEAGDGDEG